MSNTQLELAKAEMIYQVRTEFSQTRAAKVQHLHPAREIQDLYELELRIMQRLEGVSK